MSFPRPFVMGSPASLLWLTFFSAFYSFQDGQHEVLADWRPAILHNEKSLIEHRVRLYQKDQVTLTGKARQKPYENPDTNLTGWSAPSVLDKKLDKSDRVQLKVGSGANLIFCSCLL